MNKCVVGIDRDGVINEDLWDYCYKIKDFKPIAGSLEAITKLKIAGHPIVIVTNQGGIEKGIYTENDVEILHEYMLELLYQIGCPGLDGIYYSISSDKSNHYAKPNIGMFEECERINPQIKFNQGYFVGDKISDIEAAKKIGATPILVRTGYGLKTEKELTSNVLTFNTLLDFTNSIL